MQFLSSSEQLTRISQCLFFVKGSQGKIGSHTIISRYLLCYMYCFTALFVSARATFLCFVGFWRRKEDDLHICFKSHACTLPIAIAIHCMHCHCISFIEIRWTQSVFNTCTFSWFDFLARWALCSLRLVGVGKVHVMSYFCVVVLYSTCV